MPTTIYCDESGFTGELLLDRRQRFFSYASVAIESEEAADIVARIVRDYRVQGKELKGRRLLAYAAGRRAVLRIIDDIASLYSLLTTWGERHESLRVICDQSIPLLDQMDFFNVMVGRTDKRTIRMGRRESSIIFNLAEPLQLVNSLDTLGVQLADVLAAALCASMETPKDEWCHTVFSKCLELEPSTIIASTPTCNTLTFAQNQP